MCCIIKNVKKKSNDFLPRFSNASYRETWRKSFLSRVTAPTRQDIIKTLMRRQMKLKSDEVKIMFFSYICRWSVMRPVEPTRAKTIRVAIRETRVSRVSNDYIRGKISAKCVSGEFYGRRWRAVVTRRVLTHRPRYRFLRLFSLRYSWLDRVNVSCKLYLTFVRVDRSTVRRL